jgi:hypothetical protein
MIGKIIFLIYNNSVNVNDSSEGEKSKKFNDRICNFS